MKKREKKKQRLMGLAMIAASLFFAWRFYLLGYENWFMLLMGIIPGVYAIVTREKMFL